MDLKDAIIDLEFWADAKGYCVDFSKYGNDSVDFESKLISINTTRSTEIQLYTLLHECGHVLSHNNGGVLDTKDVINKYGEKTRIHRVFTVIEEVEAWKRGLSLAGRLGISVNKKKWDKTIARALKKYMEWCLDFNY
jgi:hypothetical protein